MTGDTANGAATRLGIGRFGPGWIAMALLLLGGVALGGYAFLQQLQYGEGVTGMRTIGAGGAVWGWYIAGVIFFIGVSFAGITVAAIIRLFDIEAIRPLSRAAELLTIVALLMGASCVMADLGRPVHGLLNLPKYARTESPFFGTFSLVVGGYLFSSCVYFFLAGRADARRMAGEPTRFRWFHRLWATGHGGSPAEGARHHQVSFWLAILILPLLVTAHSTLGFIFGIQGGRPGWYNALQAPGFVVMAGVSGIGVLLVISAALRRFLHLEDTIKPAAFRWLGNLLLVLCVVYLYFIIAEELTANYAAQAAETHIAHEIVAGTFAPYFWTVVGALVLAFGILFAMFVSRRTSIPLYVVAGILVNFAAVAKRFLIVVPSQTHGMLLPYPSGFYAPTWVEVAFLGGLLALGTFLYLVFVKIFPIIPLESHAAPAGDPVPPEPGGGRRVAAWLVTLLAGIGVAIVGFLCSSRHGTIRTDDPLLPFAPVVFITGVVLFFGSAVVFELLPGRRRPAA